MILVQPLYTLLFFGIGIKPDDEVIAPTYTFLATVMPIFHCGGIPILCDVEEDTGNIDVTKIENLITKKTKAIIATHMWGHPVDIHTIKKIADQYNLYLIEDFSHALGAEYQSKKVGTFGDVSCVSLQVNKIVTAGEGGMLLTKERDIYERALLFGHYRNRLKQEIKSKFYRQFIDTGYGLKLRMHPLGAVIASIQLDKLDMWMMMRNENLLYLSKKLQNIKGIKPPITKDYVTKRGWYTYKPQYFSEELNGLQIELYVEALQAEGVDMHKPDSKPLHLLPFFQTQNDGMYKHYKKVYKKGDFPKSEKHFNRLLSLPSFTLPCKQLLDQYVDAFKKISENYFELYKG